MLITVIYLHSCYRWRFLNIIPVDNKMQNKKHHSIRQCQHPITKFYLRHPIIIHFSNSFNFLILDSLSPVKGMFYLAESDEHLYKEDQSTILPDNFNNNNKNKCSLSFAEEKIDIQKYEDLLRNNIREWKSSNSLTTPNREFTCICNSF